MSTYAIYKPFGMLSQFTQEAPHHVTLADLDFSFEKNIYPIGRLDADSEGLLLLSNQEGLNHKLLDPKSKMTKTYLAQVEGIPQQKDLDQFLTGIEIKLKKSIYTTLPCTAQVVEEPSVPARNPPIRYRKDKPTTWVSIKLTEGKNRQVRKMFAKIGFPVLRLVRSSIGNYSIFDLSLLTPGQVVEV